MDITVRIVAVMLLVLAGLYTVLAPFSIGKKREGVVTGAQCVVTMLQNVCIVIIVGRCLGWW